jgi:hypothetical protein
MIYYDSNLHVPVVSDDKILSDKFRNNYIDVWYIYMNSWNNEIVSIHPSTIPFFNSN